MSFQKKRNNKTMAGLGLLDICIIIFTVFVSAAIFINYRNISTAFFDVVWGPFINDQLASYNKPGGIQSSFDIEELQELEAKLDTLVADAAGAISKDTLTFVMVTYTTEPPNLKGLSPELAKLVAEPGVILKPTAFTRALSIDVQKAGNSAFVVAFDQPAILKTTQTDLTQYSVLGLESKEPIDVVGALPNLFAGYRIARFGPIDVIDPKRFSSTKSTTGRRPASCYQINDWIRFFNIDIGKVNIVNVVNPTELYLSAGGRVNGKGIANRTPYKMICS